MLVKYINDGQPESDEFDENYVEIRPVHKSDLRREWRSMKLPPRIIAPKDVRIFQRMEPPAPQNSNPWKFDFLRRFFC